MIWRFSLFGYEVAVFFGREWQGYGDTSYRRKVEVVLRGRSHKGTAPWLRQGGR